jgi:hypothetical protein
MDELQKLIKKWDEQIALHRRVCEDPLMYTKEDRLQNSHYAQAICAVVADLKKLTIPAVMPSCEGNCGMNYCDDNGCIERKRILVEPTDLPEHEA